MQRILLINPKDYTVEVQTQPPPRPVASTKRDHGWQWPSRNCQADCPPFSPFPRTEYFRNLELTTTMANFMDLISTEKHKKY